MVVLQWAKKIFSIMVNVYLPALLFAIGVFFYCSRAVSYTSEPEAFHILFYISSAFGIVFFFITKKNKENFILLMVSFLYIALINLKKHYGGDFFNTSYYNILSILIILNWIMYCLTDFFKLSAKIDFYMICFLLFEGVLLENLPLLKFGILPTGFCFDVFWLWGISVLIYVLYISLFPDIRNYGMFFCFLSIGLGFFNWESELALSLYFFSAVVILMISIIYSDIINYFKDSVTKVYSVNTYLRHSKNFPLKYSLGVICIDNYAKLYKVFGKRQLDILLKLVVRKIRETVAEANIYRYDDDEFILIFKNEDKKSCFEYLENIRRAIAGSEFVLNSKRIVKITISAGVSEKKRSDVDVDPVLMRTREAVQRTYKFTQNMTTMA